MKNFEDFINSINEGLIKTYSGDETIKFVDGEMSLMNYDFDINYTTHNNKIELTLNNFNHITLLYDTLEHINSMLVNRYGWFPAIMELTGISGKKNKLPYNESYLTDNKIYLTSVVIVYESKFDIEEDIPQYIYHLTTKTHLNKINRYGLSPKNKSKISKHLDRIYVCDNKESCEDLIPRMKRYNIELQQSDYIKGKSPKRDDTFIIYKIDTKGLSLKLYKDPNYVDGYYIIGNIPPDKLSIIYDESI